MKTLLKRAAALMTVLMLLLPAVTLAQPPVTAPPPQANPEQAPADDTAPETPATAVQTAAPEQPAAVPEAPAGRHSAPEGFEYLKAAKANVNKYFTAIRIPGFEHTVYAFTDKGGITQFLVYGRLDKKKGMYKAEVSSQLMGDSRSFTVTVVGDKPYKAVWDDFGKPKGIKLDDTTLPQGYRKTSKTGVSYFTNLFKQKEYRVLGRLDGRGDAYYPPVYGKPKAGSLAIDISQDNLRFHLDGEKYYRVPKEYKNGFALPVFIRTQEGEQVVVWTDKPMLDRSTLK